VRGRIRKRSVAVEKVRSATDTPLDPLGGPARFATLAPGVRFESGTGACRNPMRSRNPNATVGKCLRDPGATNHSTGTANLWMQRREERDRERGFNNRTAADPRAAHAPRAGDPETDRRRTLEQRHRHPSRRINRDREITRARSPLEAGFALARTRRRDCAQTGAAQVGAVGASVQLSYEFHAESSRTTSQRSY
jgi:hypothetical protein